MPSIPSPPSSPAQYALSDTTLEDVRVNIVAVTSLFKAPRQFLGSRRRTKSPVKVAGAELATFSNTAAERSKRFLSKAFEGTSEGEDPSVRGKTKEICIDDAPFAFQEETQSAITAIQILAPEEPSENVFETPRKSLMRHNIFSPQMLYGKHPKNVLKQNPSSRASGPPYPMFQMLPDPEARFRNFAAKLVDVAFPRNQVSGLKRKRESLSNDSISTTRSFLGKHKDRRALSAERPAKKMRLFSPTKDNHQAKFLNENAENPREKLVSKEASHNLRNRMLNEREKRLVEHQKTDLLPAWGAVEF